MQRPDKSEYDHYYEGYISLVPPDDLVGELERQPAELKRLLGSLPEGRGAYAYAEGKWSIKELIGHMTDGERMFMYRIYRFARADKTALEGFDQDPYIEHGDFNSREFADLLEELDLLRRANMLFLQSLTAEAWVRTGPANGRDISVRALAFIMAGHVTHHVNILKERYLA